MDIDVKASVRRARRTDVSVSPAACCAPLDLPRMGEAEASTLASVFKALGDPSRVRIVNILATSRRPVCVCDLQPALRLSQGTVSFHLKRLLEAGLVAREQRGTWAYYSLERTALARLAGVLETEGGSE